MPDYMYLLQGPLYFEVIQKDHNLDMELVRRIFSHDIDLTARDEVCILVIQDVICVYVTA